MVQTIISQVLKGAAQLLDVRTAEEWAGGHAKPATHIPLPELNDQTLAQLAMNKPVYVYCQSGNRAEQATDLLKQKGFTAYNIGGLGDWQTAGGQITI